MIFEAIKAFVNDLGEFFAKDSHPLALYERLLNKTTLEHKEAVEKHITAFRTFCVENESSIFNKTPNFTESIVYSPRVFIDMNDIFKFATDEETRNAIWSHLLTITALVNPGSGALSVLKNTNSNTNSAFPKFEGKADEDDFLNNIISKVEQHVNPEASNPQEAIASIMSSGLITDLVGSLNTGISSGKLDLNKMMSSVQKMVGNLSGEMGGVGGGSGGDNNPLSMLSSMMSMMGGNQ